MGRPAGGGGGGGGTAIFNLVLTGSGTVGTSAWIDLGAIPTGYDYWIGQVTYTSIDKTVTFELRTNTSGQAGGSDANTTVLDTVTLRAGASATRDLYKNGSLHTKTVVGTGVEHWWIKMTSKSGTAGSYTYKAIYAQE